MKTLERYRESVSNLLGRLEDFPWIIQCVGPDITSVKDWRQVEEADIIVSDINYENDTCYIIKNRTGITGVVGLTLLCICINESIERRV